MSRKCEDCARCATFDCERYGSGNLSFAELQDYYDSPACASFIDPEEAAEIQLEMELEKEINDLLYSILHGWYTFEEQKTQWKKRLDTLIQKWEEAFEDKFVFEGLEDIKKQLKQLP